MSQEIAEQMPWASYKIMVSTLAKPGSEIAKKLTGVNAHLWHMASALAGETFELMYACAKLDNKNLKEEMGDWYFYFQGLLNGLHIDEESLRRMTAYQLCETENVGIDFYCSVGDLFDSVKKRVIYEKQGQEIAIVDNMAKTLKLFERYCVYAGFSNSNGEADFRLFKSDNMRKLAKRFPDGGYSNAAANARADKSEVYINTDFSLTSAVNHNRNY